MSNWWIIGICLFLLVGCGNHQGLENKKMDVLPLNTLILEKEPLSSDEQAALYSALTTEYFTTSSYESVIKRFTSIRPFPNLLLTGKDNIQTLKILFERYNITIPEDDTYKKIKRYKNISESCQDLLVLEKEKIVLYGDLLEIVDNDDIINSFNYLKDVTENNQVKSLEKCLS